jgi:hypothetical protein
MDLESAQAELVEGMMKTLCLALLVLVLILVPTSGGFAQDGDDEFDVVKFCFDLENLTLGDTYVVGDTFAVTGAKGVAQEFQWSTGDWTDQGQAAVEDGGRAGGWGYEIHTNNINLMFEFETPLKGLALLYGDYGGGLNLAINGDLANFFVFKDIDGANIGGVDVSVQPLNQEQGVLLMMGEIASISIGGRELWIDDGCVPEPGEFPEEGCITFDRSRFPVGKTYTLPPGINVFTEAGVTMETREFQWGNNTWTSGGFAIVDDQQLAGGSENDLNTNNINIEFTFPRPVEYLHLLFGEYGGNLNFSINGDFSNFDNFNEIDGASIGGADIAVTGGFGNDQGEIESKGEIRTLTMGGQELWIDDVCWTAPG